MITYDTNIVTNTNPFDNTQEIVKEITNVKVNDQPVIEQYAFATDVTDETILNIITQDLTNKGYEL